MVTPVILSPQRSQLTDLLLLQGLRGRPPRTLGDTASRLGSLAAGTIRADREQQAAAQQEQRRSNTLAQVLSGTPFNPNAPDPEANSIGGDPLASALSGPRAGAAPAPAAGFNKLAAALAGGGFSPQEAFGMAANIVGARRSGRQVLGPGQRLIDPQDGREIASAPFKPDALSPKAFAQQQTLRAAGRPSTTVNVSSGQGRTEFSKTIGKRSAEAFQQGQAAAGTAENTLAQLDRLERALQTVETGRLTGLQADIGGALASVGLSPEIIGLSREQLATVEDFNSAVTDLVLDVTQRFTGALSEGELAKAGEVPPNLRNTPEGNLRIIGAMRQAAEVAQQRAAAEADFVRRREIEGRPVSGPEFEAFRANIRQEIPLSISSPQPPGTGASRGQPLGSRSINELSLDDAAALDLDSLTAAQREALSRRLDELGVPR